MGEPAAWPPAARASIAPAAPSARSASVTLPGLIAAASATIPATATVTASTTSLPPASDDRSVPSGTPTADRSATVMSTTPIAASAHAIPRIHGRVVTPGPSANRPATPAPNSTTSPTYRHHLPATAIGLGGSVCSVSPAGIAVTSPSETPTPNENAPEVTWPSVVETVRHVTVYTPLGSGSGTTRIASSSPGTRSTGPVGTEAPVRSTMSTTVRERSGGSVNEIPISSGAVSRMAPFAGSVAVTAACAPAGGASADSRTTLAAATNPASASRLTTPPSRTSS